MKNENEQQKQNAPVMAGVDEQKIPIENSTAQDQESGKNADEQRDVTQNNVAQVTLPGDTKPDWLQSLRAHMDEMIHWSGEKNPKPALVPVAAGQILNQIAPVRWLGDNVMVYIAAIGHWTPARYLLTQTLTEFVPELYPTWGLKQAKEILEHAGVLSGDYVHRDQPNRAELIAKTWDAQPYITFQNGDLYVPDLKLVDHDPGHLTTWAVPCDWDPNAHSAKVDQFLRSAIPDRVGRRNYLAFLGYALARYDTSQHMFIYLKGHGSNGKSLALKLNRRLFGAYWSNTSLEKLVGSRFGAANLVFSALNFVGDQDAVFLSNTSLLKELTGFDAIETEKKFRDAFAFIAKTKLMFAVNGLPKTKDVSHGFFRRPLIIEFPIIFRQNDAYEENLLSDDTVVQALAVQAIRDYRAMLKHGGFWMEGRTQQLLEEYRADNDVVYAAVKDGLISGDPDGQIERWALTLLINFYGAERENQKLSQSVIKERLGHAGLSVVEKRAATGDRAWYVHGISIDGQQARALVDRAATTGIDGQPTVNTGNGKRKSVAEFLKALRVDLKALRADDPDQVTDPEIASALGGRGKGGDSTWI